ncbi:hypothetical protein [Micromonospora sp. NPDC048839]
MTPEERDDLASRFLLLDDSGSCAFVVSPGDNPTNLAKHWPW